uniref:Uncharacterized protein n=1 Tax=Plectus sambesii TaxID=2011161 RepID=A0A914WWL2_9BILA
MNTPKLAVFVAFICILIEWSSALECHYGTDRGMATLRKLNFPPIYECCYKYAKVNAPKFSIFGAVPLHMKKRACPQVGECFYSKELNKNMCVCANADDPNCHSGPIKLSESKSSSNNLSISSSDSSSISSSNNIWQLFHQLIQELFNYLFHQPFCQYVQQLFQQFVQQLIRQLLQQFIQQLVPWLSFLLF